MSDAWLEWIKWERDFQGNNIKSINKNPVTSFRNITDNTLGSLSRPYFDQENNKIYAAVNYPGQTAHIVSIDIGSGAVEKIIDVKGPALYFVTSLAFDPTNQKLFYTSDNND